MLTKRDWQSWGPPKEASTPPDTVHLQSLALHTVPSLLWPSSSGLILAATSQLHWQLFVCQPSLVCLPASALAPLPPDNLAWPCLLSSTTYLSSSPPLPPCSGLQCIWLSLPGWAPSPASPSSWTVRLLPSLLHTGWHCCALIPAGYYRSRTTTTHLLILLPIMLLATGFLKADLNIKASKVQRFHPQT